MDSLFCLGSGNGNSGYVKVTLKKLLKPFKCKHDFKITISSLIIVL